MKLTDYLLTALIALVVAAGAVFAFAPKDGGPLGASAGPEHYNKQFFFAGLVDSGKYTSISTTTATYTLSAYELDSKVIDIESTATGAALTLTLPATSTGAYPKFPGTFDFIVKNSHTAAATTTTIAAGTGVDLQEPDGQNVVIGITNYAYIKCTTLDTSDVVCAVDETIPAD
jgi:hypothetical protein